LQPSIHGQAFAKVVELARHKMGVGPVPPNSPAAGTVRSRGAQALKPLQPSVFC
jgi:hypothetical protein